MSKIEVTIKHDVGLHARPAAKFVKCASTFPCSILLRKLQTENSRQVNAKSILSILTLGVNQGDTIEIEAEGEDAEGALSALQQLVESNFGE